MITTVFAWIYKEYGHIPDVEAFIYGIKPAVIAIMCGNDPAGRKAIKSPLGVLGALTLMSAFSVSADRLIRVRHAGIVITG